MSTTVRDTFARRRPFPFDAFQLDAMAALDQGESVLVVAPTGSGKTLVGEYAIELALGENKRAFYTTPLKALSNQKFHDLIELYGSAQVGLLTGDNVINGDAPIVVMTTEILRNMIYARSRALDDLHHVVLDEVHYLQNAYRGPVWEEVIIHAPAHVTLVCLSATVSNAEELSDWIRTVRGSTLAVVATKRPVELMHHYMVQKSNKAPLLLPTFTAAGRPNPRAGDYDVVADKPWKRHQSRDRARPPERYEVVEQLDTADMLPAIHFIFSRNACDDSVRQCVNAGIRLTSEQERRHIRAIAEASVESLSDDDLGVLGYDEWLYGLECGVAAHHAGMVTPFKEAVEVCFSRALVKVVFATETLALGINMPARSVVIEKLTKFTGERHEQLTPGDYTQLTGRAGRRGIDEVGHAVVLWSKWVTFDQVASLASTRSYALTSSFRPTYNMAANLVRRYCPDVARHLLNLSFAQYRTDSDVVRIEAQLEDVVASLAEAHEKKTCRRGDIDEWYRARIGKAVAEPDSEERITKAIEGLKVGDVVADPGSRRFRQIVVITTSQRRGNEFRLGVISPEGRRFNLTARDFRYVPHRLRHVELPKPYNPSNKDFVRRAAATLDRDPRIAPPTGEGIDGCPEIARHLAALEDIERLQRERVRLETRVKSRTESLARQFDRVLGLLETFGYVGDWELTGCGEWLAHTYHEADLLIVESLRRGLLDDLDPPSLAAVVSSFTYEARGGDTGEADMASTVIAHRFDAIERAWTDIATEEQRLGLPVTRAPDPGFAELAYHWASGRDLSKVLFDDPRKRGSDRLSGGDFVRNIKQLLDLLTQIGTIAPVPETARAARAAADAMNRDVVAAASVVHVTPDDRA